jgi:hypothetical protein
MAHLTFKPSGNDGIQTAAYFTVKFSIAPQDGKFRMTATYKLVNQVYSVIVDAPTLDDAKKEAEKVVMASFNLKPQPITPTPPNNSRQEAIVRWSEAEKVYVGLVTNLVNVPKPNLDDFLKDPNYVWPYMNTTPNGGNARPGGGGGTIVPPRPI